MINNKYKLQQSIIAGIGYGFLHALSTMMLVQNSILVIVTDALSFTLVLWAFSILIRSFLKYAGFSQLSYFQRLTNYSVLFVLIIFFTVAINFGVVYLIFGRQNSAGFVSLIPVRALIALLFYALIVAQFKIEQSNESDPKDDENNSANSVEEIVAIDEIQVSSQKEIIDRIAVKVNQKINVILVEEIYCLLADSDYVHIYTKDNKYLKEQTMKYFEEHLPASKFVRIHRSCIINIDSISRIDLYEKQTQQLTLKNGQQLKVSLTGYKLLKMKLNI